MTRHLHLYGLLTLLILLAEGRAWGHAAPPSSPLRPAARPLPKLAVAALVQEPAAQDQKNIEDLLTIELGNQPFLQLVRSPGPSGSHEGTRHRPEQPDGSERGNGAGQVRRGRLSPLRSRGQRQWSRNAAQSDGPVGRSGHRSGESRRSSRAVGESRVVLGRRPREGPGGRSARVAGRQPSHRGHRRAAQPQRHRPQRQARHRAAKSACARV